MNKKSFIIIAIIIFCIFFIYRSIIYISKSYTFLDFSGKKLEQVFNNTYLDSLVINSAFCNENDTIYNLKLNNYRITALKLLRYKNIILNDIDIDLNTWRNRDHYFTFISEIEVNPKLNIIYKIPDAITENITLNISKNSEVYDTINYKQNKGYYFRTFKFGIGDLKNRSNIIFNFGKEKRDVVLIFMNNKKQNYLLVFYSINDDKFDIDNFLRILN